MSSFLLSTLQNVSNTIKISMLSVSKNGINIDIEPL